MFPKAVVRHNAKEVNVETQSKNKKILFSVSINSCSIGESTGDYSVITSNSNNERSSLLKTHLSRSILVLDGAMGTLIHEKKLNADDFGGEKFEGCNELLTLHRPEIIKSIHESYLKAGCDIIETNTFGANRLVLREYESQDKVREINLSAARLARSCADFFSASAPISACLSITPN